MADKSFLDRIRIGYLCALAKLVVRARRPMVIGITGTVGKTTTTRAVGAVLADPAVAERIGGVAQTAGNMNDPEGVALTILLRPDWLPTPLLKQAPRIAQLTLRALRLIFSRSYPRVLVLEMGTDTPGMLAQTVKVARPDIGILITVGPAHLEKLRTVENVYQEKMSVIRAVPPDGLAITGSDHDFVERLKAESRARVEVLDGESVGMAAEVARVVAAHLSAQPPEIERALLAVPRPKGRLQRLEAGSLLIIDDSHNANPVSMKLGLRTLAETPDRRRVAILGDMKELGDEEERYHAEIGRYARERAEVVVAVGELGKAYGAHAWFDSAESCVAALDGIVAPGDVVLVKGSNSMRMGEIVAALKASHEGGSDARIARASS